MYTLYTLSARSITLPAMEFKGKCDFQPATCHLWASTRKTSGAIDNGGMETAATKVASVSLANIKG